MVAEEYGVEVLDLEEQSVDSMARKTVDYTDEGDIDFLVPRPPVVTVMGHVDHGKVAPPELLKRGNGVWAAALQVTREIG